MVTTAISKVMDRARIPENGTWTEARPKKKKPFTVWCHINNIEGTIQYP